MLNLKNTHYRMLVSQAPPSIYKEKIFTVRALVFERSLDTSTQKIGMRCLRRFDSTSQATLATYAMKKIHAYKIRNKQLSQLPRLRSSASHALYRQRHRILAGCSLRCPWLPPCRATRPSAVPWPHTRAGRRGAAACVHEHAASLSVQGAIDGVLPSFETLSIDGLRQQVLARDDADHVVCPARERVVVRVTLLCAL